MQDTKCFFKRSHVDKGWANRLYADVVQILSTVWWDNPFRVCTLVSSEDGSGWVTFDVRRMPGCCGFYIMSRLMVMPAEEAGNIDFDDNEHITRFLGVDNYTIFGDVDCPPDLEHCPELLSRANEIYHDAVVALTREHPVLISYYVDKEDCYKQIYPCVSKLYIDHEEQNYAGGLEVDFLPGTVNDNVENCVAMISTEALKNV